MKFDCTCGGRIIDASDYLPHKAHLVADEDYEDVYLSAASGGHFVLLARPVYECTTCGRLWIGGHDGQLKSFLPESPVGGVLTSIMGDRWKAPLRASWMDMPVAGGHRGLLSCRCDEHCGEYNDWESLERRYYEIFESRRAAGTLRDALLRKNGQDLHSWPDKVAGAADTSRPPGS